MDSAVSPSARELISYDVPCQRCQYNLRGLSLDGCCPECGCSIKFSARGDRISGGDAAWVTTLHSGALAAFWGGLFHCALWISQLLLGRFRLSLGLTVLSLGTSLLILLGSWWLTTPDPSGRGEATYGWSRRLARGLLWIALVTVLLQFSRRAIPGFTAGYWREQQIERLVGDGLAVVATAVNLTYLAGLIQRIPDPALTGRALQLRLGLTLLQALLFLCVDGPTAVYFVSAHSVPALWQIVRLPFVLSELGLVWFTAMNLFFFARLSGRLAVAAKQANLETVADEPSP